MGARIVDLGSDDDDGRVDHVACGVACVHAAGAHVAYVHETYVACARVGGGGHDGDVGPCAGGSEGENGERIHRGGDGGGRDPRT